MNKQIALIALITLAACQETQNLETNKDVTSKVTVETDTNKTSGAATVLGKPKIQIPCKAGSPPIKDVSKLKVMLTNSGQITKDMSEQQVKQIIRNYINKKQQAFKRCKK